MNLIFAFTSKSITKLLLKIICLLLTANLISNYLKWVLGYNTAMGFVPLFDFDQEYNLPTLYASLAILLSAALLWWIAADEKRKGNQQAMHWKILSFIFIFLSLDEMTSLHNQLGRLIPVLLSDIYLVSESRYWTIACVPVLFLFFAFFIRFYLKLPKSTKISFATAGLIFIAGAIGVELLSDQYMFFHDQPDINYGLLSSLEELLEMIGIVLFIRALISYITAYSSEPQFKIQLNFVPQAASNSLKNVPEGISMTNSGPYEDNLYQKINPRNINEEYGH